MSPISRASSTWNDKARIPPGVLIRVIQRLLAIAACIWHNRTLRTASPRSLTAYDH